VYKYTQWQEFGYVNLVTYQDWLSSLVKKGELTEEEKSSVVGFAKTKDNDSDKVKPYVKKFKNYYRSKGYTVVRLKAIMATPNKYAKGGQQQYFAYKNRPLLGRLANYFTHIITVDSIHTVKADVDNRGIKFTLHDPVYQGKFAPAIIGNGTYHKYLLYFDNNFPFLHQNLIQINLGKSFSVNKGIDVFNTMNVTQGSYVIKKVTYPSGLVEDSADNLHTAVYVADSLENNKVTADRYTDEYTGTETFKSGFSKVGYSFVIGIIAVFLSYLLGIPLAITMARHKDKTFDKIGTAYIVFILAVPSLAYIYMFKAIGSMLGLPSTFDMDSTSKLMYVLPIISLSLPQIGSLMQWLRRYMIDQMNADYVKFARSGGLSEREIFSRHIFKNASIPIIQGVPGSVLSAVVGAIITESVYVVPGAGNLLTRAISMYDNGVIVGVSFFYAILTVTSRIMGDVLMSIVDPRISFTSKAR
jgi:oligopeptide transport system permease protein